MYHEAPSAAIAKWKPLLERGLADDQWFWDWTARGASSAAAGKAKPAQARLVAKAPGVWAAEGLVSAARAVFPDLQIRADVAAGDSFKAGTTLLKWSGHAQELLALERPFLNLAAYACAIATTTRAFVDALAAARAQPAPRVTLTRKTLPHYRDIAIDAVIAGGGHPHRIGLGSGVLIKENHIASAGSIARAIEGVRDSAPHGLRIECEVRSIKELDQALRAGADAVLLDNFTPARLTEALAHLSKWSAAGNPRPLVEVSGGITLQTVGQYARAGVDVLSVGALTHSVRAVDLSLLFDSVTPLK